MFVGARTEVYNGMIFGEHSKDTDLDCNPCNAKHVSNVRTAGKDEFIQVNSLFFFVGCCRAARMSSFRSTSCFCFWFLITCCNSRRDEYIQDNQLFLFFVF